MSESEAKRPSPIPAWIAIVLAAGWLGVGAYYKLMYANSGALPPVYKGITESLFNWNEVEAYRWAVTMEFVVVALALLRPRLGWFVLATQYAIFILILAHLQAIGETSCGCFGSKVQVKPLEMLAFDVPLFLLLVFSKPWKRLPKSKFSPLPWLAVAVVGVIGLWAPHKYFTTDEDHHPWWSFWSTFQDEDAMTVVADGDPYVELPQDGDANDGTQPADEGSGTPSGADPASEEGSNDEATAGDRPDFVRLEPTKWVGQMIDQTKLGRYMEGDPFLIPDPAHVILYRRSCEHCRDHLEQLFYNPITDREVVLIELREDGDEEAESVLGLMPDTPHKFDLISLPRGYGLQTPWSLELEGWVVTSVEDTASKMDE